MTVSARRSSWKIWAHWGMFHRQRVKNKNLSSNLR